MANQSYLEKTLKGLETYQYADAGMRLASNEETTEFAKGALEKLVIDVKNQMKDEGLSERFTQFIEGLRAGTFASQEGTVTALNIWQKEYQKLLGSLDVADFYKVRYDSIKSILGEKEANEAKAVFDKYKGQKVGDVKKKYLQAKAKIDDKTELYNDKQKEEAKKVKEKLEPIYKLILLSEQKKYEELRPAAMKPTFAEEYKKYLGEA